MIIIEKLYNENKNTTLRRNQYNIKLIDISMLELYMVLKIFILV